MPNFKRGIESQAVVDPPYVFEARYEGRCGYCQEDIEIGDPIAEFEGEYVHASDCLDMVQ